jgi:hypothetical protein
MRLYAERVVPRFDDIRVRAENDPWTGRGELSAATHGARPGPTHRKRPVPASTGHVELPSI